jgi:hypothetical protein
MRKTLDHLFITTILPCILTGKSYETQGLEPETLYCYCQREEYGDMIGCDSSPCSIEWFHYGCVGLKTEPPGSWYCPDCSYVLDKHRV